MRSPKKNQTPPVRQKPDCYCITDEQGTALYRIETSSMDANPLQLQHFQALRHFFSVTDRPDRLHAILTEWFVHHMSQNFGTWEYEDTDLADFGQLLEFLSRCYRRPTPTELENLLQHV